MKIDDKLQKHNKEMRAKNAKKWSNDRQKRRKVKEIELIIKIRNV